DGYVWIGCDDGVARFDGLRFVSFGVRDGLRGGPVRALLGDSRGALWVGSAEGLSRWADGYFTTFTTNEGLPARAITALAEDANGHIWVGSENGLAIGKNGHFAVPVGGEIFKGKPVTTLFKDRKGNMWIGATGAGIFCFRNGKFSPLNDGSVESLLQDPHCILIDQSGPIWIGAGDDFVLCRVGGQWHRFRIPRHLARPYITALAEEPDGTVWAGSISEGLFQFRGGKLAAFNAGSGLPDNLVESLLVDREGKLWVGTDSGLSRLRRKRLFAFGQNDGLGYGAVQSIAEIAPGIIWAAKANGGLCRWAGRTFSRVAAPGLDGDLRVHALLATHDGGCWVADEKELRFFENAADSPVESKADALTNADVIALAQGADGAIWAGTRYGKLWHWQNSRWTRKENFEPNCAITAIEPDRDGGLWIGTDGNGLFRLRNSQHTQFNKNNGLVSDSIRTLYLDAQGTLWIGTSGGGLSRWNGREIKTFTTREGLPDNTISQILEDSSGRLWLGSNQGVASVSKRDLEELANGKVPAIYPKIFGLADGMLSEECTSGFFPAGLKIKPGLLWFSTAKGIVVADARPHAADVIAPRAVVEEMLLDGVGFAGFQPTEMSERSPRANGGKAEREFHIKPGRHRLEFRYTGLGFDAPERMRFRYQLEGLDPDWVEAGTRRVAFYSYVPPGKYRFRVIACNNDGVWDETGATVAFVVMRHFWQAGWVIFLGVAGVLISVGGAARFMEKRRLHRRLVHLEQERALQRERARIAEDLHDDLGSSLARISLLSGLAKADKENPGQVESHVNKIAQSAAQTVRALEEIVWAVRPGSDSLQSLVEYIAHFASELFEGNTTRCRLDLPHDLPPRALPPDVRHNIFLIVKEALTNALKHASAGEVRVQAKVSMNTLEITVQDDGNGFDPNIPRAEGKQNGLGNMRRRAEAVAGTLDVQTARGKGTVVKLIVNLKNISPDAAS
ncbi:MAG TPA: two-component regulator propeller domain-containing protein, partial [Verrucomicrobiae bacterium]|nr:two-component regulator propeller domain-containing protein [Verrucomicrobiae bacterium]